MRLRDGAGRGGCGICKTLNHTRLFDNAKIIFFSVTPLIPQIGKNFIAALNRNPHPLGIERVLSGICMLVPRMIPNQRMTRIIKITNPTLNAMIFKIP